jgi:uncharacterized protein
MSGELVYWQINVPDAARARTFFSAVLGWSFEGGNVPDGYQIAGAGMPGGLHGGDSDAELFAYFAVPDLDTAVTRVRELGGEADEIVDNGRERFVHCRDDQGVRFSLFEARE